MIGLGRALSLLALSVGAGGVALVSVEEEIEIGRQANAQVRERVPELRDELVGRYVQDAGKRLARVAPGPKYPYSFSVADEGGINAFSLPGGPIWINRGVLQRASNESQVAAVLAHEVAHLARRHAAERLTQGMVARWGLGLLGALLGNSIGAGTAQAAAGLLTRGALLQFSRDEERDADATGLEILTRAGWDGRGMLELLEMLKRESAQNPGLVEAFMSSHPSPQDRLTELARRVGHHPGGRRDSRQFRAIRTRLGQIPPPPARHNR